MVCKDRITENRLPTPEPLAQLICNCLEKFGGTSGGGFHSNETLNYYVYSGIEKLPLLLFG